MFLRRSAGFAAALFSLAVLVAAAGGCSSKTYRDINYGTDLGRGWRPEAAWRLFSCSTT